MGKYTSLLALAAGFASVIPVILLADYLTKKYFQPRDNPPVEIVVRNSGPISVARADTRKVRDPRIEQHARKNISIRCIDSGIVDDIGNNDTVDQWYYNRGIAVQEDYLIENESGLFIFRQSNVAISIPDTLEVNIPSIYLSVKPLPAEEKQQLPGTIVSDLVTLLPCGLVFKKHILVRFPLREVGEHKHIQLMYCRELKAGESNHWIHIDTSSRSSVDHSDPVFFYVHRGQVYLFTQHFCSFVLMEHSTLPPQRGICLQVSACAKVNKSLTFTIGVNCKSHLPNLPEENSKHGTLFGEQSQCFYEKEGPVSIAVDMKEDGWLNRFPIAEMPIDDLFNACQFKDLYIRTILFRPKPGTVVTRDREISAQAVISQKQRGCAINIDTSIDELSVNVEDAGVMTDVSGEIVAIDVNRNHQPEPKSTLTNSMGQDFAIQSAEPNTMNFAQTSDEDDFQSDDCGIEGKPNSSLKKTMPELYKAGAGDSNLSNKDAEDVIESESSCSEESDFGPHIGDNVEYTNPDVIDLENHYTSGVNITSHSAKESGAHNAVERQECYSPQIVYNMQKVNVIVANGELPAELRGMMSQLGIETKQADCLFNRSIPMVDQDNLCEEIDSCGREVLNHIAERNGAPENFNQMTALQILQVWKLSVHEKTKTWRELYDILIELGCESAALKLKCVCDKDNVISNIEELKNLITVDHILTSLIGKDIVDLDDRHKIGRMIPSQAVEYLVYDLLLKRPYSTLQAFFRILYENKHVRDYLKRVMIYPEDLEMTEL